MSGVEEPVVVEEPTTEYAVVHSLQEVVESKTHEEDETVEFKMYSLTSVLLVDLKNWRNELLGELNYFDLLEKVVNGKNEGLEMFDYWSISLPTRSD